MHSREFPPKLDISRLSKKVRNGAEVSYSGTVNISELTDIKDILANVEPSDINNINIELELKLKIDEQAHIYIEGHMKGVLAIRCERCLEAMPYVLDKIFCLSPIEDAAQDSPYEPVVLREGCLIIADCVTEEILLSLPLAPKHEDVNCNVNYIH